MKDPLNKPGLFLDRLEQSLAAVVIVGSTTSRASGLVAASSRSLQHDLVAYGLANDRLTVATETRGLKQEVVRAGAVRVSE